MKKIAIMLLLMLLSDSSFAQWQPIASALAKNDRGSLLEVVEAREAFIPDPPIWIQQNSIWSGKGTDVRSTSLRSDRPTGIQQNSVWSGKGTFDCGDEHSYRAKQGKSGTLSILSNPVSPSDTEWLYWEAQPWIGVNNEFALDTMRLFVSRFPTYHSLIPAALNYTGQIVALMADTGKYIETQPWIDQYNWLTSVYTSDTATWYEQDILLSMAAAENYFNLNEDADLYWNIERLFPFTSNTDSLGISFIREYQSERGLDTTPFHIIQIPPLPYGASMVESQPVPSGFDLSVAPNPANQFMVVNVTAPFSAPATLEIYDALGHLVENIPALRLDAGSNPVNIDCAKLVAGNYYLRFSSGDAVLTKEIIVEH